MLARRQLLRHISWRNPVNMEKRQQEKEEQAFKDDIKYFMGKETFSLHDFHDRVMKGIKDKGGVFSSITGQDSEKKVLDTQNKVLSAMYDGEKTDWKAVSYKQKKEIIETA